MTQEATQKSKDVQTDSNIVTGAVLGEIERLKEDLDRLHRERDAFQQQCSVMAEENARLELESQRLKFLIENQGKVDWDFNGNCYVVFIHKNKGMATKGGDDVMLEIDRAMEMCK